MSKDRKQSVIKYICTFAAGICLSVACLSLRQEFPAPEIAENMRHICDAFTVPGMIFILTGGLIALINAGALDGMGYAAKFVVRTFFPVGLWKKDESYYDYVQRQRSKPIKKYGYLFIVGGVNMVIALVFLILFYVL